MTAFSDLSGAEVPKDKLGRLVVRNHPDLSGSPVYLEALPEELAALDRANMPVVTVEWQPPGEGEAKGSPPDYLIMDGDPDLGPLALERQRCYAEGPKTVTLSVADFDKLSKRGRTSELLADAPRASGGRRSSGSGEGVNYATLENAGRLNRGKISPEEAEFVRNNLAAVNERLAREGERLIDPTNKEHKERYGF